MLAYSRIPYRISLALCLLSLGACSFLNPKPETAERPPREQIQGFTLEARAAIIQAGNSNTLRMNWAHTQRSDQVGFASPLGSQLAELQRDERGARWINAEGEIFEADSPEKLLARLTETPLPLDKLALWVIGLTDAATEDIERDASGRLQQISSPPWIIRFRRYENEHPNALPQLLEIEGPSLRIKLAIENWQL